MIQYKEMLERATQINKRQLEILYLRMDRPTTQKKYIAQQMGVSQQTICTDFIKLNTTFPELSHLLK